MLEPKTVSTLDSLPAEATCQEASPSSHSSYIPCGRPATHIVETDPGRNYPMCLGCAWHNTHNRGAKLKYGEAF